MYSFFEDFTQYTFIISIPTSPPNSSHIPTSPPFKNISVICAAHILQHIGLMNVSALVSSMIIYNLKMALGQHIGCFL